MWWLMYRGRGRMEVRRAIALVAGGALAVAIAYGVLKSVNGGSEYTSYFGGHGSLDLWQRAQPLVLFAVTCAVVGFRSPVALLAAPTLLWRMASNHSLYWGVGFHYDALLAVIALIAGIDGFARLRRRNPLPAVAVPALLAGLWSVVLGVNTVGSRFGPVEHTFTASPRVHAIQQLAMQIPAGASVATTNSLGAYVVADRRTYDLKPALPAHPDYVYFAGTDRWIRYFPACAQRQLLSSARVRGWTVRQAGDLTLVAIHRSDLVQRAYAACPPSALRNT